MEEALSRMTFRGSAPVPLPRRLSGPTGDWEISDSTYTFQLSRSYDGGETWSEYPLTRAGKVSD